MLSIRDESINIFDASNNPAPAAAALIPSFLNGAIGTRLPDHFTWVAAYERDPETKLLLSFAKDPSLTTEPVVQKMHWIHRQPSRDGQLFEENGILFIRDLFKNNDKCLRLQVVPVALRKILFVAFHYNPIGDYLDTFCTYNRIRLRFSGLTCLKHVRNWQNIVQVVHYPILQNGQWAISFICSLFQRP